jgi:hypothetical protein
VPGASQEWNQRQQNDHDTVPDLRNRRRRVTHPDFDSEAFHCPAHGRFEVSRTAMMTHRQKGILEWERAFERAEARARGSRPRIEDNDFL